MGMTRVEVMGAMREGRYDVRPVLAGAYRGADISSRTLLSHVSINDADGYSLRTLCGRVPAESLADVNSLGGGGEPSCRECAARLARFVAGTSR